MIEVWTDGACSGNPGPGGWAYIIKLQFAGAEVEITNDGAEEKSTNIRMEYVAILKALETIESWPHEGKERIWVFSDCQMVINCITGVNKKCYSDTSLEFLPQIKVIVEKIGFHLVNFKHIYGHIGFVENERVNKMAKAAIKKI